MDSGGRIKDTIEEAEIRGRASDAAAQEVATFKQLLKGDLDDALLESFIHFTATGNGNKQMWKDMQTFFRRKLKGYRGADGYQRNAIINEFQRMGVNSMLSGPKTPVRALVGTGLQTIMRPTATILGSIGKEDDLVLRGAYATLGGMVESHNDAWRKAVADWNSYSTTGEGWRNFTRTTADQEWDSMMSYFDQYGTLGEKATAQFADMLRGINKVPFLNYGPRVMKSMDTYFTQIIGRGRLRQLAYDDVYKRTRDSGVLLSDADFDELTKAAEMHFESKVFDADGNVTDEMALFSADEAKLTQELTGTMKKVDQVFEQQPFLRPFFLFARTGVNALKMTSKYTPILNRFITEHADLATKAWDDPDMIKYGIKSPHDLEIAQATMRGRVAIGRGVTTTAALMALNGNLTGNGPPDRRLRDTWMQAGWRPRSIKIGGTYVSYEALEPFNMFLSFTADIVDSQKVMGDQWTNSWLTKTGFLLSQNVVNKSFLAGLMQLQDLFTSNFKDAPRVLANFTNNQVPLGGLRNEVGKLLSPGMRELESGFWQSIGNRNLWADIITEGEMLPFKYDLFSGEKINDYNPVQRLTNAILPVNLNIGTTPAKEFVFKSGINLKQTFHYGPNGEDLEGYPDIKSRFQFYMSQMGLEQQIQALMTPQMIDSIKTMEEHKHQGRTHSPSSYIHAKALKEVFTLAKRNAWVMLQNDAAFGARARHLTELHKLNQVGNRFRAAGDYERDNLLYQQIEALESKPIK
jgi:hypothetical protein